MNNNKDVTFLQWNGRGIRRNLDFLQILINQFSPVAIAWQETRMSMAMSEKHTEDCDFLRGLPHILVINIQMMSMKILHNMELES